MRLRISICMLVILGMLALSACSPPPSNRLQGYVEGDFVYVASPLAGALESLTVQRGQTVKAGDPLFALDCISEQAAKDEAVRRLAQSRSLLEDAKKGKRPTEIESIDAQLRQARAALDLSNQQLTRQRNAVKTGAASADDVDRARSQNDQNLQHVAQLTADLATAKLGQRTDQVAAAEEDARALEAALAKADWDLSQKKQAAPQGSLVFDTLYRQGEWIAAGHPVVVLLPPPNVKVRAFVPETALGRLRLGDTIQVFVDGVAQPYTGKLTFISPQAEYTPPVIYSRETREKLVFLVELHFDTETAAKLHPGQPVDIALPR